MYKMNHGHDSWDIASTVAAPGHNTCILDWIPLRHSYALILIQLYLDEDVNTGIETILIDQMMK